MLPYPGGPPRRHGGDETGRSGEVGTTLTGLAETVQAARRGEAEAWDTLFTRFHPDVHAYALARLGDWASAEDVTQEVFAAAVSAIRRLRDDREPAVQAWFLHICRHKIIDHLRRSERRRPPVASSQPAPDDPEQVVEARLLADELRAAMRGLTEDQRDVLIRRFVLDQPLEAVAGATRRSLGAVKSMQHRALATLERVLGQVEAGG
jgi:RNA polymerase sigma-70 factor (ECF subfamily)